MRLLREDDVLDIIERVTNDAVENKKPKYLIQKRIIAEIAGLEPVDAELVKHGRWIRVIAEDYECSECKAAVWSGKANPISNYKYCWRCGAKMEE